MALPFDRILVPTDFSECARSALAQAISLARQHRAELHFLHVMLSHDEDPYSLVYQVSDQNEAYRQQQDLCAAKLEQLLGEQPVADVAVHQHLRRAFSVAPAILDFAAEQAIDFVVMGAHGRRGWRRFLLGSVAEEVVRLAPSPVLTVRQDSRPLDFTDLGRIAVPIDFSEPSRQAFKTAQALATAGSELELVHVVQLPVFPHYYDVLHDPSQEYAFPQIALKVEEAAARFVRQTGESEISCRVQVLEGAVAASIAEYAARADVDLVVIATHGLSGLKHLLLGSVTEKVVRSVARPVLTVKGAWGGEETEEG